MLELIEWMSKLENFQIFKEKLQNSKYFPAPEQWREAIRDILYILPDQRIELANALEYLPIQITLTLPEVTTFDAKAQRFMQIWACEKADLGNVITVADKKIYHSYSAARKILQTEAAAYLRQEKKLIEQLKKNGVPLSFLQIFNTELKEIEDSRSSRRKEIINCDTLFKLPDSNNPNQDLDGDEDLSPLDKKEDSFEEIFKYAIADGDDEKDNDDNENIAYLSKNDRDRFDGKEKSKVNYIPDDKYHHDFEKDVLKSAKNMKLWALAFSGGGIRSATFNLGVLQGLAKKGLLSKFDYLSTVSGGGYIGSWLVSWIARNRSVIKISDRLDPKKSTDPTADEVWPIRWLRMYSNYLTPTKGIMSADSWTVGMTLLRNMFVSQLVILSFFLALIASGRLFFMIWKVLSLQQTYELPITDAQISFNVFAGFFLIIGAILAGFGMQSYHRERFPNIRLNPRLKSILTHLLIAFTCAIALVLSGWIFRHIFIERLFANFSDFGATYLSFRWIMLASFIAMVAVGVLGRYDVYIGLNVKHKKLEILHGIFLTLVAVAIGGVLLALVCKFGVYLAYQAPVLQNIDYYHEKLLFIFLPPLVIEVLSMTVVLRMAFLGASFPDERREWWGRIGGLIHRICLIWMLLLIMTMFGKSLLDLLITEKFHIKEFFIAGWGATLIVGLKAAFSGKTSGDDSSKSTPSKTKELLALGTPYLFVIGLMIFLPELLSIIQRKFTSLSAGYVDNELYLILLLTIGLVIWTWLLSARVGVNQFSMHLFYRNRLVRAYLGATRIAIERERSAHPFTGFDAGDDLLLANLVNAKEYFGPYPIINATLSASANTVLDRQDRKAESFIFSPHYCGYDFSTSRATANAMKKSYDYAYRPTSQYAYAEGPHIGTAMAISGAAASPNMGYHTSAATAFLLSLFNIRLGWWMGNPRMSKWKKSDPEYGLGYLISDLTGDTDTSTNFICLSDGGHFDNMGLYELIRRKCKYIILSDGEQDGKLFCEGLANTIRRCRIEFGVEITFKNLEAITDLNDERFSEKSYAIGKIKYPENENHSGILLYIKASMTEKATVDLQEYAKKNKTFPHQSTADQFFNEEQFESYRKLGMNIVDKIIN